MTESLLPFLRRVARWWSGVDACAHPNCIAKRTYGTIPAGPSEDYKRLLRGEIDAPEYVRRLKRDVDRRLRRV